MADYYSVLGRALSKLDNDGAEARQALYDRARAALIAELRGQNPLPPKADIARECLTLEAAISKVELEVTTGGLSKADPRSTRTNTDHSSRSSQAKVSAPASSSITAPPETTVSGGRNILGPNKATIELSADADRFTFLRSSGHLFLDELVRDAALEIGPQAINDDLGIVLRWLGVAKAQDIDVLHRERWASGFERYLAEGRAPTLGLASAFEHFKKSNTAMHRNLDSISAPLSDDIRGVFDRMLGTDNEIADAKRTAVGAILHRSNHNEKTTKAKLPYLQGVLFFAAAFTLVLFLEALLVMTLQALTNSRLSPRGLGWIVVPIGAGMLAWAYGVDRGIDGTFRIIAVELDSASKLTRGWIAGSVLWTLVVCGVFTIFDPFGRYEWRNPEWLKFLTTLFGPPLIGAFGIYLFGWAVRDNRKDKGL